MKASLRSRLERLEARTEARTPALFRSGWLKPLPKDQAGDRHVVIIKREPTGSPNFEWCEFEERPGPAPPVYEDPCFTVYLTEDELRL
jgi:hypothetical protein